MPGQYSISVDDISGIYYILESDVVVAQTKDKKKAYDFVHHMEQGGAFDGKTPEFLINSGPVNLDAKTKNSIRER